MTANEKKTFVLDTNVILHDYRSIYNFTNNDIVIPIVVLEELDKFKKGNDLINFHVNLPVSWIKFPKRIFLIKGQL